MSHPTGGATDSGQENLKQGRSAKKKRTKRTKRVSKTTKQIVHEADVYTPATNRDDLTTIWLTLEYAL